MTVPLLSLAMDKREWLTSMEAVLEALNEGVVITNENHRILFANSRFVEMTGIPKQDLIGSDPSQFYSPQELDFVAQQIDVEFRHGHNRYAFVLPRRDGGRLPVIISSRTLENSGRQFGIVTFTDISEQVRTAEELLCFAKTLSAPEIMKEHDCLKRRPGCDRRARNSLLRRTSARAAQIYKDGGTSFFGRRYIGAELSGSIVTMMQPPKSGTRKNKA